MAEEVNGILLLVFLNSNDGDSRQFEASTLKDNQFIAQIGQVSFKTPMIVVSEVSNHYHFKRNLKYQKHKMLNLSFFSIQITGNQKVPSCGN